MDIFDLMDEAEEDKKVTQYLVPANVSARFELWEGFGFSELKICVIAFVMGIILFFLSGLFVKTVQYDKSTMPMEQTIGLKEDENTIIKGNLVIKKEKIIPDGVRFFFVIVPTVLAYFCVKRDRSTGMNLIDNILAMKEFNKKQKRYLYKYRSGSEA